MHKHHFLTLSLAAGAARAAHGTLEINEDCMMAGCFAGDALGSPVTIVNSGHYRLTSDLDRTIAVAASATDVDLGETELLPRQQARSGELGYTCVPTGGQANDGLDGTCP